MEAYMGSTKEKNTAMTQEARPTPGIQPVRLSQ